MVTIQDVARVAGVGVGTVSRVLNEQPGVRPATRQRVLDAIEQLQFRPSPIARSMISKRTDFIGVMIPFFTRPFQTEMLRGIQQSLAHVHKELILYNVETDAQREYYFSQIPMHRKVDGLLIISLALDDAFARRLCEIGLPTILVDAYSPHLTSLVVDNIEGAYQAVHFLIKQGHRRIGFINGIKEGHFKFNQANDRLIGYHRALSEARLLFDPELVVTSEWSRQSSAEVARSLLTLPVHARPSALFVASDVQALGALEAAQSLGIAVPEELSLIGYDGIELSELFHLSTIQQPILQMGELSINKLIDQIMSPQRPPELIRLPTHLIERHTTGPAPGAGLVVNE